MDKIELLPVSLLSEHDSDVQNFRETASRLGIGLGWHYLLDLSWVVQQFRLKSGMRVLDAGAGTGVMQWWLAERGVDVISADRLNRQYLSKNFRQRYRVLGLRKEGLANEKRPSLRDFLPPSSPFRWHLYPKKLSASVRLLRREKSVEPVSNGTVYIYNQDLSSMPDIANDSVDAVVSISSLEHNSPDDLKLCLAELMRVLKPGGRLVVTMMAAKSKDWFHKPSRGWCYTEATLRKIFDLPSHSRSNYDKYDELFEELRNCDELRDNLADFYFQSGNNGMPWGGWDPKYQPVGVVKTKK